MPGPDQAVLDFYTAPAVMTTPGRRADLFDPLPADVAALAAVGHGLLIHEHLAHEYGVALTDPERDTVHVRPVAELLEAIATRDGRALEIAREPAHRVAGNCRHFTVLIAAMLRHQGTPARARCGFGNYFGNGLYEDHWVCEYWDAGQERWRLVDAQIDRRQRELFGIDFDLTDVPRDRFVIAGDAWADCRAGRADPDLYGLSTIGEAGYWWIAGNLMRDSAALRNVELLPWDVWGAMPSPGEDIEDRRQGLFDDLAALTQAPDAAFAQLGRVNEEDWLRVPPKVHNALRDRDEAVRGVVV